MKRWNTSLAKVATSDRIHLSSLQGPYNLDGSSVPSSVFGAMSALGTIAFAYEGHNVVLEIQVRFIPL